jgi:hypothetical protein
MIFLREIKSEPLFISSENVEDYEMHESGFGTVVIDKNGFVHHVMESLEEVEEILAKGSNVRVDFEIGIGNRVSPKTVSIKIPNNVPSRVNPIVIFPTVEAEAVTVKVTEYDNYGCEKQVYTTVDSSVSHVINLNTGVE